MLLFVFALISILFSFLCSIWEAVLLSIPATFVETSKQKGAPYAAELKKQKSEIDQPLSAILSLNTIAHTVGAIGVGAQAESTFGSGPLFLFGQELPFSVEALVAAIMTLAILILSEIIPKTVGATYWKQLVGFTVRSLGIVMIIMKPFVWISQRITTLIKGKQLHAVVSREEISAMGKIGHRSGIFDKQESTILMNLMRFHEIVAKSIMTPDTVVVMADEQTTLDDFYKANPVLRFSRIPIYGTDKEDITGYILKDTLLDEMIQGNGKSTLAKIRMTNLAVTEETPIQTLFNTFLEKREQIAMVYDEFGAFVGIVTMEDVLETLLGLEIVDELDETTDMQALARAKWRERAAKAGLIEH